MNATQAYHELLEKILNEGTVKQDRTGTGTKSIFHHTMEFDMSTGKFPLLTTKKLHIRSIIYELLFFLRGDTNIKYLNDNGVTIWDEWAREDGSLGPVYGKQWVNWEYDDNYSVADVPENLKGKIKDIQFSDRKSINQIQQAIDTLNNNPDSRRILVSSWNVGELESMALMPCHWAFELYTEELTMEERMGYVKENDIDLGIEYGDTFSHDTLTNNGVPTRRLSLKWHQRSVDTFLGLPFNIASYAFLLHMFAQQTNMVPGTLVGDLTNVHIYDNHIEYVKEQLERDPLKYVLPKLELNNKLTLPERNILYQEKYGYDSYPNYSHDTLDTQGIPSVNDIFSYKYEDFNIVGYESFPNWKGVPIAV